MRTKSYPKKAIRKTYRKRANVKRPFVPKRTAVKIKKVVSDYLSRRVETKVVQMGGNFGVKTLQTTTTSVQFSNQCIGVTPQGGTIAGFAAQNYPVIGNGVGQDQRIGDECRIKGQYLSFLVQANGYNASTNPAPKAHIFYIWVVKPKVKNAAGLAYNQILGGSSESIFFENQTDATSGLTGSLVDMIRKVDSDNFEVIAVRQYKLGFQGTLNTSNSVASMQVNDFNQFAKGKIKIPGYVWKVDRNEVFQGRNIYMFATCLPADGSPLNPAYEPYTLTYNLTTYYTDM